jgi:hypothetical protein
MDATKVDVWVLRKFISNDEVKEMTNSWVPDTRFCLWSVLAVPENGGHLLALEKFDGQSSARPP